MEYEIATRELPARPIMSIRDRRSKADIPEFIGRSFGELFGRLGLLGVTPAGPPFVIYHEFADDAIDAEVCVPIAGVVAANGHIQARTLPPVTVATTLHVGPYEELGAAYTALTDWVARSGREPVGPMEECYLNGPADVATAAEYRTEIALPVSPVAAAIAG